jgi:hypothetical protein
LISGESLKKLIGDFLLDEALGHFVFDAIANLMRVEIRDEPLLHPLLMKVHI